MYNMLVENQPGGKWSSWHLLNKLNESIPVKNSIKNSTKLNYLSIIDYYHVLLLIIHRFEWDLSKFNRLFCWFYPISETWNEWMPVAITSGSNQRGLTGQVLWPRSVDVSWICNYTTGYAGNCWRLHRT